MVLVDAGQLLYHVVWPVAGTAEDLGYKHRRSTGNRPSVCTKSVLFDRYNPEAPSAKDHERTRRGIAKTV